MKNEHGSCEKNYISYKKYQGQKYRVACIFPEIYELGICNLGHQIIHDLINQDEDFYAERLYFSNDQLYLSEETGTSIEEFDYIFVSLSFESNIINYVKMMSKRRFSIFAKDRKEKDPIIIAGGLYPSYNAEPFADFFDAVIIGEGEICIKKILDILRLSKSRSSKLDLLSEIKGVYIPQFYLPILLNKHKNYFNIRDKVQQTHPVDINQYPAYTRISSELSVYKQHCFAIEIRRGCNQNCRFCVMASCNKPPRTMSLEKYENLLDKPLQKKTNIIKLFYEGLLPDEVEKYYNIAMKKGFSVRIGSQRLDTTSTKTIDYIAEFGQRKITFAPETNERLRPMLGKSDIRDIDLYSKIEYALQQGIKDIGLYFMIGLPNETPQDLSEISNIIDMSFNLIKKYNKDGNLVIGINPFYPKPNTALGKCDFVGANEALKRLKYILDHIINKEAIDISNNYADETVMSSKGNYRIYSKFVHKIIIETSIGTPLSYYQTILSRGDRRIADVLVQFVQLNEKKISIQSWEQVLSRFNLNANMFYHVSDQEIFPWDIIDHTVSKRYLNNEYKLGLAFKSVDKCSGNCAVCRIKCRN